VHIRADMLFTQNETAAAYVNDLPQFTG
jgi:hypothetical protein